ncbi:hypothetical protein HK097_001694 [Rhizophlyctis rosea]|uniref:Uncharacterized protein n=1 Tax=Rhizophlyctis rosea TaxID=64517 RepID=A0AAD5S6Y9_9FUNG|nr:hypothetical protein HK097_001694 [Rhizophlyctis rosea]
MSAPQPPQPGLYDLLACTSKAPAVHAFFTSQPDATSTTSQRFPYASAAGTVAADTGRPSDRRAEPRAPRAAPQTQQQPFFGFAPLTPAKAIYEPSIGSPPGSIFNPNMNKNYAISLPKPGDRAASQYDKVIHIRSSYIPPTNQFEPTPNTQPTAFFN